MTKRIYTIQLTNKYEENSTVQVLTDDKFDEFELYAWVSERGADKITAISYKYLAADFSTNKEAST